MWLSLWINCNKKGLTFTITLQASIWSRRNSGLLSFLLLSDEQSLEESGKWGCLPVQRRHAVDGLQAAAGRHHIEAVSTVTWHMEVVLWVTVLHDDDKPRPPVSQIVTCHSFPTLINKTPHKTAFLDACS